MSESVRKSVAPHGTALARSLQVDHEDSAVASFMERLVMVCDYPRIMAHGCTWHAWLKASEGHYRILCTNALMCDIDKHRKGITSITSTSHRSWIEAITTYHDSTATRGLECLRMYTWKVVAFQGAVRKLSDKMWQDVTRKDPVDPVQDLPWFAFTRTCFTWFTCTCFTWFTWFTCARVHVVVNGCLWHLYALMADSSLQDVPRPRNQPEDNRFRKRSLLRKDVSWPNLRWFRTSWLKPSQNKIKWQRER